MSAVVNGVTLDVSQVQVDRALPDPLAGGSLTAASASFTAVEGADVARTVATPWDPGASWPPVPESPASVSMDAGAGPVSLMQNGRVVSASGGTSGREVSVEVSDAYQSLDRPISWDGWAAATPALTEATTQRLVSLRASALTDRILRHCGWYATPPMMAYSTLSVPAMGTMWPERGECITCTQTSGSGHVQMFTEPWGVAPMGMSATYRQAGNGYAIKDRGRMELTAIAGRMSGSTLYVQAEANGSNVRLSWNDNTAYAWVTNPAGVTSAVLSRSRSAGSFLYMTVEYVTDTSVKVILRVDGVASEATVPCRSQVTTAQHTTATIYGEGSGGGFQIAYPSTTGSLASWKPNAVIYDRGAGYNYLEVAPPVYGENCADLLAKQCAAQNATYWIDETGVLRWWDLARLEGRPTVASLNSDDDIAEAGFTWDHSLSSVKRSVSVEWREPLAEGGWRTDVDLWQGNGATVSTTGANNPVEDWINVPDDEVWLMPDLSPGRVGESYGDFNYGWGTWYGGITDAGNTDTDRWAQLDGSLLWSIQRVNDRSFKTSLTWTGTKQATQRTLDNESRVGTGLWRRRTEFDLPILRGKKKYTLGERVTEAAQKGPATAPDHVIDAGWWIQNETQAQRTADYAAARLTVPQPVLSSVALVPIPGLQLGDVVTVTDAHVTRLTIRGLVVEDSRTLDAGMGMSHAVAIRPVAVSRNGVTWAEWASVARPKTWAQWSTNQDSTWQQWGSDPLGKE